MYPSLFVGGNAYYMTWLGIFVFLAVFVFCVRKGTQKYRLPFRLFSRNFPILLIIVYLSSTYTRYLVSQRVIFPVTLEQLLLYLSPWQYRFYLWGILWWAVLARNYFKKYIPQKRYRLQRMFVFIKSALRAAVPLWIFLTLGDTVIWKATDSRLSITALSRESNVATYGRVIPRWIYFSILAIVCLVWMRKRLPRGETRKRTPLIIAIALFWLNILLLYQIYPRYLVIRIGNLTADFKNYIVLAGMLRALRQQLLLLAPTKPTHETDLYDPR